MNFRNIAFGIRPDLLTATALACLAFVVYCSDDKKKNPNAGQKTELRLMEVKAQADQRPLELLGSVSYFKKAEVTSKVLGRVEKLYKEEGNFVKKGTVLARIETLNLDIQIRKDRAALDVQRKNIRLARAKYLLAKQRVERALANTAKARADVQSARTAWENLKRNYAIKKKLHAIGAVSDSQLKNLRTQLVAAETAYFKANKDVQNQLIGYRLKDLKAAGIPVPRDEKKLSRAYVDLNTMIEKAEMDMARANMKSIQASLDSTRLLLRESSVRSPITGIVAARSIEQGEAVKENAPLFTVVDTSRVLIRYSVNESDVIRVRKGGRVPFTLDAFPDKKFNGTIFLISPIVDPRSRTVEIKVLAQNPGGLIRPGMFSRGRLVPADSARVIRVPASAILKGKEKGAAFVFIRGKNGLLFKKPVKVGPEKEKQFRVLSGLRPGDYIASGSLELVSEGQKAPPLPGGKTGTKDKTSKPTAKAPAAKPSKKKAKR